MNVRWLFVLEERRIEVYFNISCFILYIEYMKGIIFDMDGVLIDSMPFHAEAMRIAIKEETNHDIDEKLVYLLEGMPSAELVKEIFKREKIDKNIDDSIAEKISKRKKEIFKEIQNSKSIEGARELVNDLRSCSCLKAVVSGSAKQEIEVLLDKNIGSKNFDMIITGDELGGEGKPDPKPFQTALQKMNLNPSEVIVVENSPLGVEAASKASLKYIVTLNNTPLDISSDFEGLISKGSNNNSVFKDTKSASSFLKDWCCKSS
jgi:beta-phosphoglucomutase